MNSFMALLLLFTIAAQLSGRTTFALPTSADVSTTIPSIATSTTTPSSSSSLICDCKYVQEGCWIQTNATKVRHFQPNVGRKDLAKEAEAWQCDKTTETCAIERGNEVWKRYEAAFVGDQKLPREAVAVCTKRTFGGQKRRTALFGCGIHWHPTPVKSYEQQKALCRQYNESQCVYVSDTRFPKDPADPVKGGKDCSPGQTTRTCDCLYYDKAHDWKFTNKSEYVGVLGHLERPRTADLQRTLLAWNCWANETCTIDIKDRANEYRKQFFGHTTLPSTAVPVCTQHTFYNGSKEAFGYLWGCAVAWTEPLTVESQMKFCESNLKESSGVSECVFLNEERFKDGKYWPISTTHPPTGTRPPTTTTTTTTPQPTTTSKASESSSSSPVQVLALLTAVAAAWAS